MSADTSLPPGQVSCTARIEGDAGKILEAWCDPVVQDHLFAGAAERVLDTQGAVRWHLNAPLGRHPAATVSVVERMSTAVVHAIEGDGPWGATSRLTVLPVQVGTGNEVTLWLEYEIDGVFARLLASLVSVTPQAAAEEALRRLRDWVHAHPATSAG